MAAYLMVQSTINNEEQYQKYRESVVPLIMKFGGKFSIRGGKVEVLEGQPDERSMVVFEFQQWKPSTHSGIHRSMSQ